MNYIIALPLLLSVIFLGLFKAVPVTAQVTDQDVYKVVEKMPQFPGCENVAAEEQRQCSFNKLVEYVANNLRYPESARKDNIEGKVVVKFVVEATGVVSGIQVVRSLTADCDTEVIRVMESMNSMPVKWHPGEQKGEKVPVEMVLPVQFAL